MFEWDEDKAAKNLRKHKVAFAAVEDFEWDVAVYRIDHEDGEERLVATSFIGNKLHVLVYVERGDRIRVISLRRAEKKEVRRYEEDV